MDEANEQLAFLGQAISAVNFLSDQLVDSKTGFYAASVFQVFLDREFSRFQANRTPFSLILFSMNYPAGPLPLEAATTAYFRLGLVIGQLDMVGYFGQSDFAVLMPGVRAAEAAIVASKAYQLLSIAPLARGITKDTVSFSFGVAGLPDSAYDIEGLIKGAALAKNEAMKKPYPVSVWGSTRETTS